MTQHDSRKTGTDDLQFDNDFWRFSLAVYGQDEIAQECHELQRSLGADINLLLFCAWLGARAIALSRADIEAASNIVAAWHENVVRPLRAARQQVRALNRDELESFRSRVKGVELEAEQIEQAVLFAYSKQVQNIPAGSDCRNAVAQNVKQYLELKSDVVWERNSKLACCLVDAACRLTAKF